MSFALRKKIYGGLASCLLLLAAAETAHAVSCDDLNQWWSSQGKVDFKAQWSQDNFSCPSTASAIAQAMYDLATTTFLTNDSGYSPNYYSYVIGLIGSSVYGGAGSGSPPPLVTAGANATMTFYDGFASVDPEWATASLVHEARHLEQGDPGHVPCAHGPFQDDPEGCDEALYDQAGNGSGYNYSFQYLWWVKDGADYTELDRDVAAAEMKSTVLNRFNTVTNEQVQRWAN